MNRGSWRAGALLALAVAAACGSETTDEDVVARLDDYTLTVDDAVELLVDEERLAADVSVVETLAELWVDYTLLAEAAARDTTFARLDFEPLVMRQLNQVMMFQLRDSVLQVDTFVTDDELRVMYEEEAPEVEFRASHIMLRLPLGADQAARDSVRNELARIRERVARGEDFGALARQFSQDPPTARLGGDLGLFGRGDMVAPFEEAVLQLDPGQISPVVETPMGLHVIRLDDRRTRSFEEAAAQYRRQVQGRMVQEAESVFIAGIVDPVELTVTEGAAGIVREMAEAPGAGLTGRAARRALVEWEGGSITVGDVRELLQLEPAVVRNQVAQGDDEAIEAFLLTVAQRGLLVAEAEAAGLRPARDSVDVLVADARQQLRGAARRLGLLDLDRAPGEELGIAVQRAVKEALADNLSGATQIVPLGLVAFQLREGRSITVLERGIGEVIVEVAQIRAARQLAPIEQPVVPDTVG